MHPATVVLVQTPLQNLHILSFSWLHPPGRAHKQPRQWYNDNSTPFWEGTNPATKFLKIIIGFLHCDNYAKRRLWVCFFTSTVAFCYNNEHNSYRLPCKRIFGLDRKISNNSDPALNSFCHTSQQTSIPPQYNKYILWLREQSNTDFIQQFAYR